jgi:predicted MFS family arabinose efflux permease
MLADLLDGLRYVGAHPRLRLLVGFFVTVIMTGLSYSTVLFGHVAHALGRPATEVPPLFFTSAVGGLTITLLTARFADSRRAISLFVTMPFLLALGLVGLSLAPSYALAIAAMFVLGSGFGGFQTLNAAVIVRTAESAYFGRVFSLTMLAFAGVSLVSLPVSVLADAVGERVTLASLGGTVLVIAAVVARLLRAQHPSPEGRR